MFAAGTSTMLGSKTLLLDLANNSIADNIGGDCTNSACVPSKALRSIAKLASMKATLSSKSVNQKNGSWFFRGREHMMTTVSKVRARESPQAMVDRNPNLDIALVLRGQFVRSHEMTMDVTRFYSSNSTKKFADHKIRVRGKKFIIATGASPIVPEGIEKEAKAAELPIYTYRTLLRPDSESFWQRTENKASDKQKVKIVIAGGGAAAMELCQSLARLGGIHNEIHLIAPELLPGEDVTLQNAALQLLLSENIVTLHLGRRLASVLPNKSVRLSDGTTLPNADTLLLCLGRRPDLESLHLDKAGIVWNKDYGVIVRSNLQSISASHVYACGDCASAVNQRPTSRTSTHGAWTGYHAASNAVLPRFLTVGSKSVHPTVPRVIFTDPELACVGMTLSECMFKYGEDGFDRLLASEEGTDRADMESQERRTSGIGFVEIRATKVDGTVLGMTACGPTASELANEMSIVIEKGLTVRDIARSLHSYPSHGYLLHRVALALALGNIWGSLEACGPVGGLLAHPGRLVSNAFGLYKRRQSRDSRVRAADGAKKGVLIAADHRAIEHGKPHHQIVSFLDVYKDENLLQYLLSKDDSSDLNDSSVMNRDAFLQWSKLGNEVKPTLGQHKVIT
jgi:pyruvate/2-oxoglutarate dehydrogenase complex dihydrolipoamide dehydrogenase (E3) component